MKSENGSEKRIAERKEIGDDRRNENIRQTQQFISEIEQGSLEEALDIIERRGSIRLIAV